MVDAGPGSGPVPSRGAGRGAGTAGAGAPGTPTVCADGAPAGKLPGTALATAPPWDMCSIERIATFGLPLHHGFNAAIDALSTAATTSVVHRAP